MYVLKTEEKRDVNFQLFRNTRRKLHHALKGISKSSPKDVSGIHIDSYKKRIEFRLTLDMTGNNIDIDHVKPFSLFDISEEEEMKEAFNWKNTQPLLKEVHRQNRTKHNFLNYRPQYVRAFRLIKSNEEVFNKSFY